MSVIMLVLIISWSIGANGQGVEPKTSMDTPIILSENPNNSILRLWTSPGSGTVVLYDHWNLILFGDVNESYQVKINNAETFNGSLVREVQNFTFDASGLSTASVSIEIGNRSYQYQNIQINHQGIDYGGPGSGGGSNLKYSGADLSKAQLKTASGVIISSLISIPIVWNGVKLYRARQGVREI